MTFEDFKKITHESRRPPDETELYTGAELRECWDAATKAERDCAVAVGRADAYEHLINDDGSLTNHEDMLSLLTDAMHALNTINTVIERKNAAEAALREALEIINFYADACTYMVWTNHPDVIAEIAKDNGRKARNALPALRRAMEGKA